jgi:hypothetical protein
MCAVLSLDAQVLAIRTVLTNVLFQLKQLDPMLADAIARGFDDSTPVLLPKSSLAQPTFVPSRKAESQLPLTGTRLNACPLRQFPPCERVA